MSGISLMTRIDSEKFNVKVAGEVKNFTPEEFMDSKEAKRMARFTQLAIAASKMAVKRCGTSNRRKCRSRACWSMDWFRHWRFRCI
ncbi:hypothetical protein GCM10020331_060370 [Ectobacillus funiculus]